MSLLVDGERQVGKVVRCYRGQSEWENLPSGEMGYRWDDSGQMHVQLLSGPRASSQDVVPVPIAVGNGEGTPDASYEVEVVPCPDV